LGSISGVEPFPLSTCTFTGNPAARKELVKLLVNLKLLPPKTCFSKAPKGFTIRLFLCSVNLIRGVVKGYGLLGQCRHCVSGNVSETFLWHHGPLSTLYIIARTANSCAKHDL